MRPPPSTYGHFCTTVIVRPLASPYVRLHRSIPVSVSVRPPLYVRLRLRLRLRTSDYVAVCPVHLRTTASVRVSLRIRFRLRLKTTCQNRHAIISCITMTVSYFRKTGLSCHTRPSATHNIDTSSWLETRPRKLENTRGAYVQQYVMDWSNSCRTTRIAGSATLTFPVWSLTTTTSRGKSWTQHWQPTHARREW